MIGYTDRATRCSGSRSRIECSSTPAPNSGYMFWIAPIQTPIIPVRRSPKYFQVSESGPSGAARRSSSRCSTVPAGRTSSMTRRDRRHGHHGLLVLMSDESHDNVDNRCCLRFRGASRHAVIESRPVRRNRVIRRFVAIQMRAASQATATSASLPVSPDTTYPGRCGTRAPSGVRRARANGDHAGSAWFTTAVRGVTTQRGGVAAQPQTRARASSAWSGERAALLPGDPEFGDPLSTAGDGGPRAAARAAGRLLGERGGASREFGLGALQVWQALTETVSRRPANPEVTLVFTDLVGFSTWSLQAGDDATLKLLRRVARAVEPPLLDAGGHIVKRMGDGIMAVFADPLVAVGAVLAAKQALKSVDVDGYTAADAGRYPHRAPAAAGRRLARGRRQRRRPGHGACHQGRRDGVRAPHWMKSRSRIWMHWASPPNGCTEPVFAGKTPGIAGRFGDLSAQGRQSSREKLTATFQVWMVQMTKIRRHSRCR